MSGKIIQGDCLKVLRTLESDSIDCCVTSPPYFGLRDYGVEGQMGLEIHPSEFVKNMTEVFSEVRRVLKPEGTLWLNIGDSYAGSGRGLGTKDFTSKQGSNRGARAMTQGELKERRELTKPPVGFKKKDLIGIPWRIAFSLQDSGWYLRQDIIWSKPNPMPESVEDRCTKAHEYIFLFSKSPTYYFDSESIKEPVADSSKKRLSQNVEAQLGSDRVPFKTNGPMKAVGNQELRNKRSVWSVATRPFKGAHFATFPPDLIRPCVKAGCPEGGVVLDPFFGAGTTGLVATEENRNFFGIELNPEYIKIAEKRLGIEDRSWESL